MGSHHHCSAPAVIELFAGAGGFSLGFNAAGCRIQAAVDADEAAGATFRNNFSCLQPADSPVVIAGEDEGNLEELDFVTIAGDHPPDILIGGPPCQGFSRLGRAKLDDLSEEGFAGDPRNDLYRRFIEAAGFWRPRAVVMENVPGMLSVGGRNVAEEAAVDLAKEGYRVGYAVLNAAWYGVPQFRERVFFMGIRADLGVEPAMPEATHRASLPSGYLRPDTAVFQLALPFAQHRQLPVDLGRAQEEATTVSEALDDLPALSEHLTPDVGRMEPSGQQGLAYPGLPHSAYARLMRAWPGLPAPEAVGQHWIRRTPRDFETFRRMKPGDRYPEALRISQERLDQEIARLAVEGRAPERGSREFAELERRFIPPYPEDMFVDKWRKLIPHQPSWTVPAHLAKDSYSHIHHDSTQARAISVREAARLQSFPDAFAFSGNMGDCFRQIGNAVPPLLSWAIAGKVLELLGMEARRPPLGEVASARPVPRPTMP